MGCCCVGRFLARRRGRGINPTAVVPEPSGDTDDVLLTKQNVSVQEELLNEDKATSSTAPETQVQEEEDLGDSEEDGWIDDESSGSDPGLPPEIQWAKQAKRQEKQKKRRQRAARMAKRAAEGATGGEPSYVHCLDLCYSIGEKLGRGTYASVSRCTHLSTKAERALKSIDRKQIVSEGQLREEIEIMRMVGHPHVVKWYDTFEEDPRYVYVVMELCLGGELFDHVASEEGGQGFAEDTAARVFSQIASAVQYLHSVHVAHRDLKPENVMLTRAGEHVRNATVKVIDFSLSRRFEPGRLMHTLACTPQYVAPEVLAKKYTESCDVWSLGVLVYVLLSGSHPFSGDTEEELFKSVKAGQFDFDRHCWASNTEASKDLIRRMLLLDVSSRISAEQVVQHAWLQAFVPKEVM